MLIYRAGNYCKFLENIKHKKVLILGSGPSARDVDWKKVNYDMLFTTSFFYKNNEVVNQRPSHVSLSKLVDLNNPTLNDYLTSNPSCTISFEPKIHRVRGFKNIFENMDISKAENQEIFFKCFAQIHKFYRSESFKKFFLKFKKQIMFFRAEGGLEGLAGRIIWPIFEGKPSKIYMCGVDGFSKDWTKDPQNYFRSHQGTPDKHYSYEDFKTSFEDYANRIYEHSISSNIPIENLGKGYDYNLMTPISERFE